MGNLYHYAVILLPIILIIKFLFHGRQRQRYRLPPSPFALPVIGHLHLLKPPLYQGLQALSSQYGPILFLRFGCRPSVVVSSPSAVQECFTKNDVVLANRPRSMIGDHVTYNYTAFVWASYGHLWRVLRRLTVVEIFSSNKLLLLSTVREEEVRYLLRQLFKVSNDGAQKVDMRLYLSLFSFNFIMKTITGKRCIGEEAEGIETNRQFLERLKRIFVPTTTTNLCDFFPILRWVGYKGLEKSVIQFGKERDGHLQGMLDEFRRNNSAVEWQKKRTLIETLLFLQQSEPDFYTDDVIKGLMLVVISAGTDTSSVTLEWAMSLLLNHPEALEKARAEIDRHVEPGHLLDDSDLAKLPYLRSVVNETLRLYPTAPLLLPHLSSEDCSVGGFDIPRGTTVMVNVWALHRDPRVWEEATKFKPERFEGMENEEKEAFKFAPFGIGRRACPGSALAMKIVSLALGGLIQCFEWERVEAEKVDMSPGSGITMPKAKPLEIIFRPRPTMTSLLSQL